MVHSRSGRLAFRAARKLGNAVETTTTSSAAMKVPMHARPSVQRGRGGGVVAPAEPAGAGEVVIPRKTTFTPRSRRCLQDDRQNPTGEQPRRPPRRRQFTRR